MPHDQNVRASQQIGDGPHGFHENAPFFRITQIGFLFSRQFCFLALPHLIAQVVDDRQLKFVITLVEGGHAKSFHNRITVFHTISQSACGGINYDTIHGHAQIFKQNIDLFGQIDINGGG